MKTFVLRTICIFYIMVGFSVTTSYACSRVLFVGSNDVVLTGRTMDWKEDVKPNLWIMPRGVKRNGVAGENSIKWTAKYGSIVVSVYDAGTVDGMNEKGLVANLLFLAESDYGAANPSKPKLSVSVWAQYALDNFASVNEAVVALNQRKFQIMAPRLADGSSALLHLSLSDSLGDSAIFEYIKGQLVIHHGKQYQVMTNSPTYDEQLELYAHRKEVNGFISLPGTNCSTDRFARATFFLSAIPKQIDHHYINAITTHLFEHQAIASMMGIMRNLSVPIGLSTPNKLHIASTQWRTIADQKNKIYYYDSVTSPNMFWVALSDVEFKEGSPIMKLSLINGEIYTGNVAQLFIKSNPFHFLPIYNTNSGPLSGDALPKQTLSGSP